MNEVEANVVRYVYIVGSFASIIGCFVIIITFFFFKKLRTFNNLLVFWLTFSDLGGAIINLLSIGSLNSNRNVCIMQASFMQFFDLSSFLWTGAIATHAFLSTTNNVKKKSTHWLLISYFGVCFGVPLITAIISLPPALNITGQATEPHSHLRTWCWISGSATLYRFLFYYGPLLFIWLYNAIIYIVILRRIRRHLHFILFHKKQASLHLRLYLLVFIISKLPGLINRTVNAATTKQYFILYLIQAIFDPLQGTFNSIVYGMNKHRRKILLAFLGKIIMCGKEGGDDILSKLVLSDSDEDNTYINDQSSEGEGSLTETSLFSVQS